MPIRPTILAWDPNPPSDNVLHYNVYEAIHSPMALRALTALKRKTARSPAAAIALRKAATDDSYVLVGSSTTTTYSLDETGLAPGIHYYVVTAVDNQNRESGYSNEVAVTVLSWRIK